MFRVSVNEETCIGCGVCYQVCPVDVFKIEMRDVNGTRRLISVVVDEGKCTGCNLCVEACPTDSIKIEKA